MSTSHSSSGWVSSHSGRSSGCSRIGAPVATRSAGATRTWSSWAWVHRIALTVRPATTARMSSTECGASMTTQSLVVADDPDVVVDLVRLAVEGERAGGDRVVDTGGHENTTTERRTQPSCILVERRLDVAEADLLGDERVEVEPPLLVEVDEHREVARGQAVAVPAGLEGPSAAEDVDQRDVGHLHVRRRHADQDDGAGQVAGVERLLPRLGTTHRVDHDVGAVAVGQRLDRRHRVACRSELMVSVAPMPRAHSSFGRRCRRR